VGPTGAWTSGSPAAPARTSASTPVAAEVLGRVQVGDSVHIAPGTVGRWLMAEAFNRRAHERDT
jgi:carbonic anhydrase/acetyltransferase-like protein (isoleucine patch superfamily)